MKKQQIIIATVPAGCGFFQAGVYRVRAGKVTCVEATQRGGEQAKERAIAAVEQMFFGRIKRAHFEHDIVRMDITSEENHDTCLAIAKRLGI